MKSPSTDDDDKRISNDDKRISNDDKRISNDDKRISKKNGISTFARGHKDLGWSPILGEVSLI